MYLYCNFMNQDSSYSRISRTRNSEPKFCNSEIYSISLYKTKLHMHVQKAHFHTEMSQKFDSWHQGMMNLLCYNTKHNMSDSSNIYVLFFTYQVIEQSTGFEEDIIFEVIHQDREYFLHARSLTECGLFTKVLSKIGNKLEPHCTLNQTF